MRTPKIGTLIGYEYKTIDLFAADLRPKADELRRLRRRVKELEKYKEKYIALMNGFAYQEISLDRTLTIQVG